MIIIVNADPDILNPCYLELFLFLHEFQILELNS